MTGRNAELAKALVRQEKEGGLSPWHAADRFGIRGELFSRQGQLRRAIAEFDTALARKPSLSWAVGYRCGLFRKLGEYERTAACNREAGEKGFGGVTGLVRALVALGNSGEAVSALCESIAAGSSGTIKHKMLLRLVREHGFETLPENLETVLGALEEAAERPGAKPVHWCTLVFLRLHGRDGAGDGVARAREASATSPA